MNVSEFFTRLLTQSVEQIPYYGVGIAISKEEYEFLDEYRGEITKQYKLRRDKDWIGETVTAIGLPLLQVNGKLYVGLYDNKMDTLIAIADMYHAVRSYAMMQVKK